MSRTVELNIDNEFISLHLTISDLQCERNLHGFNAGIDSDRYKNVSQMSTKGHSLHDCHLRNFFDPDRFIVLGRSQVHHLMFYHLI